MVHLIMSARCALIGQRYKERLNMQRSQLERFCGFPLHKPDKFSLGALILHHSSVCLCVTWLMTLLSSTQKPIWPIKPGCICCASLCPPCGCENILNPPDTQLERAPTWPPTSRRTKKLTWNDDLQPLGKTHPLMSLLWTQLYSCLLMIIL